MSAVLAIITAGIAKITMNDVTTCAQTKIGIRFSAMPGARSLNAVVMIDTATASDATSVNVIICAHTSGRLLGREQLLRQRRIAEPADVGAGVQQNSDV